MSKWKFPLHFIDFETSSVALPFCKGMHPYEPVAFQFSHHVLEKSGTISHSGEFLLTDPGVFPNFKFAEALKSELQHDEGTVLMWSHHENTIISKIILQLRGSKKSDNEVESLIDFLESLIKGGAREMVDLRFLAEKAFFHPDTNGSNSIKKVLPAVLKSFPLLQSYYSEPIYGASGGIKSINFTDPNGFSWIDERFDPYLKLRELAESLLPEGSIDESIISEGGAAATAYARLQFEDLNLDTRDRINHSLRRYCELVTLAMVMVVQGWGNLS